MPQGMTPCGDPSICGVQSHRPGTVCRAATSGAGFVKKVPSSMPPVSAAPPSSAANASSDLPNTSEMDEDDFQELIADTGEQVDSVDLLASRPHIRSQIGGGPRSVEPELEVNTYETDYQGQKVYMVIMEDGGDSLYDFQEARDNYVRLEPSLDRAHNARDEMIMDWESNFDY